MLRVPDFEIRSVEETMRLIKQKIPLMGDQWNDTGESDPGITILELFSYMNTAMQERLDTITKKHLDKYLRLLGVSKKTNRCSRAIISVIAQKEEPYVLLKGTKLLAGDVVFETDMTKIIYAIHIKKLYHQTAEGYFDLSRLLNSITIKEFMLGRKVEAGNAFYIGLSSPLWNTTNHSFYFWLDDTYERNPLSPNIPFALSKVRWEYYDGQKWTPAQVLKDETNSFLCSGYITFHIDGQMEPYQGEGLEEWYYLRAVAETADYDIMPVLCDISLSAVEVVQKDTVCHTFLFSSTGADRQTYLMEHALAMNGKIVVEVLRDNGEWIIYPVGRKPDSRCNVLVVNGTKPFLYFDRRVYGVVPEKGENNIRVTCYQESFDDKRLISFGTGLIRQTYALDFNEIDWNGFSIVSTRPTYYGRRYYEWKRVDDLADASEDERAYQIDMGTSTLLFGDGIHGAVPAEDETIIVSNLSFTRGAEGNVKPNEINRFQEQDKNEILLVSNHLKSTGGKNQMDTYDVLKNLESFRYKLKRAVTKEHYKTLVSQAPGLALEKTAIWSYWDLVEFEGKKDTLHENTIYISILPYGYQPGCRFFEKYRAVLLQYLENYRMVTTNLEILEPELAGIEVYGTIYIKEQRMAEEGLFRDKIQAYFDSKREFGEELSSGELYAILDTIDSVEYIENINFECSHPGCKYGHNGNLILHPNAVCFIKSVHLEFKR